MMLLAQVLAGGYRTLVAPLLHQLTIIPGGCRLTPTCSRYWLQATRQYGLGVGFVLLVKRLGRCQPFGAPGYDPIP